ncbi:hypothetical protein IFM89_018469 [Coptis chinensis]|uniref:SNF2 N-terminal domain-containing protein n=1 Tax=Coptis chinensis TaxID=261450 RepID=A0A835H4S2_9MAGN|nr:hypothetical protein IFM89_018469 [Coptis chinensis]
MLLQESNLTLTSSPSIEGHVLVLRETIPSGSQYPPAVSSLYEGFQRQYPLLLPKGDSGWGLNTVETNRNMINCLGHSTHIFFRFGTMVVNEIFLKLSTRKGRLMYHVKIETRKLMRIIFMSYGLCLIFLLPKIFSSAETFDEWFQISGENDQQEVVQQLHKVKLLPHCKAINILLTLVDSTTFLLLEGPSSISPRRLKSDVEKGLPLKRKTILKVGMSQLRKRFYRVLLRRILRLLMPMERKRVFSNIAMQLQ